ncbi:MAG: ribosomal-processing cysteine protease Prp [Vulcanimicrobiaceae bacterium]
MVEVRIAGDGWGPSSFVAGGHAGWDEPGHDVLCAAISALLQAAWLGLAEVAVVAVEGERRPGHLSLRWPPGALADPAAAAIVATVARSLERLAEQYPAQLRIVRERASGPRPDGYEETPRAKEERP